MARAAVEDAVGPEDDPAVAAGAGEALAFVDQAGADAEAARRRLDQQHAQLRRAFDDRLLRRLVARLDEEDAADVAAVALGDPAGFARRIEAVDEVGGDPRHQRLEAPVPAVLAGIERAVAADHPADVAVLRRAQQPGRGRGSALAVEQLLDRRASPPASFRCSASASGASRAATPSSLCRSSGAKARLPAALRLRCRCRASSAERTLLISLPSFRPRSSRLR